MGRVAFLPEEFAGAEEWTCTHLPAHHVTPLVAHQGQVAPRLNPVLIGVPDNGLRSGADDEFLFQLGGGIDLHAALVFLRTQTVVGHHGALLGESLHVFGFPRKKTLRNQQWEIGVLGTSFLEHHVQLVLHLLPNGIAIRFNDHTSTHGRLLGKVGFHDKIVIPLTVIVSSFCQFFQFFCHCSIVKI